MKDPLEALARHMALQVDREICYPDDFLGTYEFDEIVVWRKRIAWLPAWFPFNKLYFPKHTR